MIVSGGNGEVGRCCIGERIRRIYITYIYDSAGERFAQVVATVVGRV